MEMASRPANPAYCSLVAPEERLGWSGANTDVLRVDMTSTGNITSIASSCSGATAKTVLPFIASPCSSMASLIQCPSSIDRVTLVTQPKLLLEYGFDTR